MAVSAEEWREHRVALERWRDAYRRYLDGGEGGPPSVRDDVDARTDAASQALPLVECEVAAPALDGNGVDYTLRGVIAWLHDRPRGWVTGSFGEDVLETIQRAIDDLRKNEDRPHRRA